MKNLLKKRDVIKSSRSGMELQCYHVMPVYVGESKEILRYEAIYDSNILIFGLTNKCRIEKLDFIKWREQIHLKQLDNGK